MRLIDADAFKQELKENYTFYGFTELLNDFYVALDEAPTIDALSEWIPCSEKLPNENGDYLVTLENGVVKTLGYSTTQRTTYPKGFYHIKDGFSWRQVQNPVIAWMPLPKPYEEVKENE